MENPGRISKKLTLLLDDQGDSVEEPLEARVSRALVIDELDLDCLHGSDCENGLTHTCTQTTKKAVARTQGALGVHSSLFEFLKGAKSEKIYEFSKFNYISSGYVIMVKIIISSFMNNELLKISIPDSRFGY